MWAGASLAGLALLFQEAGWLYHVVRLIGATYLIVAGILMIRAAGHATASSVGPAAAAAYSGSGFRSLLRGIVTDLSNPKAAAFFTSLFAVAVPASAPLWFHGLLIAIVVVMAFVWYGLVAVFMGVAPVARTYNRFQAAILRATGAVFVGFGVKLAADR